jgi:hypothetical protein
VKGSKAKREEKGRNVEEREGEEKQSTREEYELVWN